MPGHIQHNKKQKALRQFNLPRTLHVQIRVGQIQPSLRPIITFLFITYTEAMIVLGTEGEVATDSFKTFLNREQAVHCPDGYQATNLPIHNFLSNPSNIRINE